LVKRIDWSKENIAESMARWRESLKVIQKAVAEKREAAAEKAMAKNKRSQECNVQVGDYVPWSRVDERRYSKLLVTWIGPYRVVEVAELYLVIEHLLTSEKRKAHTSSFKRSRI
jgi:hypothetical protein